MFSHCSSLNLLDLSSFKDTSKVNNMSFMFSDCSSLKSINITSFNTCNVKDMRCMFYNCDKLESIYISSLFNLNEAKKSRDILGSTDYPIGLLSMFNGGNILGSIGTGLVLGGLSYIKDKYRENKLFIRV